MTGPAITKTSNSATATSFSFTGLAGGIAYTFKVSAVNQFATGAQSVASAAVTAVSAPAAPTALAAVRGDSQATLSWTPGSNGGSPLTSYVLQVRTGATVVRTDTIPVTNQAMNSTTILGLTNGTAYNFRLQAVTAVGSSALSTASANVTPATVPGAPGILAGSQGAVGGGLQASANWTAPTSTGGSGITGYLVSAYLVGGTTPLQQIQVGSGARTRAFTFSSTAPIEFQVVAINAVGSSAPSARSAGVVPR